jgi:trimeric autotransporter adhesin
MRPRLLRSAIAAAIGSLLLAASASANTITVDSTADTSGDTSICTLRDAIKSANWSMLVPPPAFGGCADGTHPPDTGPDTIDFSLGTGPHTIQLASVLPGIGNDTTVTGPGDALLTVRGELGTEDYTVMPIEDDGTAPFPTVTLEGMKITNGSRGIGVGAALAVTLNDVIVSGNTFTDTQVGSSIIEGAGIADTGGANLAINDSTISGNSATATTTGAGECCSVFTDAKGGAISITQSGTLSIDRSTISNNAIAAHGNQTAQANGAIFDEFGDVTITRSTISGNTATATVSELGGTGSAFANGGAITQRGAGGNGLTLDRVTVTGNTAATVTGSANGFGSATGGGILVNQSVGGSLNGSATGSTISGNTVSATGLGSGSVSGANVNLSSNAGSVFSFQNTIIANPTGAANCAQGSDGTFSSLGYNVDSGTSCLGTPTTGDQTSTNPALGSLLDNGGPTKTMAPGINSPAVDKGTAAGDPVDQRGLPRTFDMNPANADDGTDVGAFEQTIVQLQTDIDFDDQMWGTSTSQPVSLLNRTGNSLTPGALAFSGTNPGDFLAGSDTCSNTALANNATCTANAVFHPVSAGNGARSASLSFPTNVAPTASVGSIALTGAVTEYISLVPSPKDYGATQVGTPTAATVFTVENAGPSTSGTFAATLTGANASEFGITGDTCTGQTLADSGTCTVSVRFAPSSAGAKTASLDVTGTPGGTSSSALTGTGTGPPSPPPPPNTTTGATGQRAAALKKCKKKKSAKARNKCKKKAKKLPV